MTKRDVEKRIRHGIGSKLPGYHIRGRELFAAPVGLILKLVYFEASRWDRDAYSHIHAVAMPLWIPFTTFWFNTSIDLQREQNREHTDLEAVYGRRLLHWPAYVEGIALPMFERLGTAEGLLDGLKDWMIQYKLANITDPTNPLIEEVLAGAAIICHRLEDAGRHLAAAIGFYDSASDLRACDVAKLQQLQLLQTSLQRGRAAAIAVLKDWDAFTVSNLKLEPFLASNRWDM